MRARAVWCIDFFLQSPHQITVGCSIKCVAGLCWLQMPSLTGQIRISCISVGELPAYIVVEACAVGSYEFVFVGIFARIDFAFNEIS